MNRLYTNRDWRVEKVAVEKLYVVWKYFVLRESCLFFIFPKYCYIYVHIYLTLLVKVTNLHSFVDMSFAHL